jgi:hypothetical protein
MRKKSPVEREISHLLDKKKLADQRWETFMKNYKNVMKFNTYEIARYMNDCDWADYGLTQKNINLK